MTTVNVTTQANTVEVTTAGVTTVVQVPKTSTVTATTAGPQGPPGPPPFAFDGTAKVDKSVIYYHSASSEFRADDTWTISTIVKGGDF